MAVILAQQTNDAHFPYALQKYLIYLNERYESNRNGLTETAARMHRSCENKERRLGSRHSLAFPKIPWNSAAAVSFV